MKTRAVLLFAVGVLAVASSFQGADATQLTSESIQDVLSDFLTHVFEVKAKSEGGAGRRKLKSTTSVQSFLEDLLGSSWTDYLPTGWSLSSFDWSVLGEFSYENSLQEFLNSTALSTLARPQSLAQLVNAVHDAEDIFCTPASFTPPEAVPPVCSGPIITLALEPKYCDVDDKTFNVTCTPAQLTLTRTPGGCAHKSWSPVEWTGKTCAITGELGFADEKLLGGNHYTVSAAGVHLVE